VARTLYDLAGADPACRFSPYCWRTKMALAHKGLGVETIPWRFTDKETIAFSGQGRVPVLVDGARTVSDSWTIANYLEDTYPDAPSLFGGDAARGVTRFVNAWADTVLLGAILRVILMDIYTRIDEKDKAYFRESREQRFGMRLEDFAADGEGNLTALRRTLEPVRATLAGQPYLGGSAARYADYIVFGCMQWARCISPIELLAADDPVAQWRGRLLDLFDGFARTAPAEAA
jgi:glutathione S-transferase